MGFRNGIITVDNVLGIPVNLMVVEPGGNRNNVRTLRGMTPEGITIHNTGNTRPGACDVNHGRFLQNMENSDKEFISWHFTVDKDSITQHIPVNETAYHAGDGRNGFGNSRTIGIEIAENLEYEACEENGIKLMVWLMKEFNWGVDKIEPHRKYSSTRKLCPRRILKSEVNWERTWDNFRNNKIVPMFNSYFGVKEEVGIPDETGIKVGDTVKFISSAKQWNGKNIRSDFKKREYIVKSIDSNGRTVLTIDNKVMYAVDIKYLEKVSLKGIPPVVKEVKEEFKEFLVRVRVGALNIRKTPNGNIVGQIRDRGVYTIVELDNTGKWGRLKSGVGWIHLDYVKVV